MRSVRAVVNGLLWRGISTTGSGLDVDLLVKEGFEERQVPGDVVVRDVEKPSTFNPRQSAHRKCPVS